MATQTFRGITYTVQTVTGDGQTAQGTQNPDWIEAQGSNNSISTGKGNDVILSGVTFGGIGNPSDYPPGDYPPYGNNQFIKHYIRLGGGNNFIDVGNGDDYVVIGKGNYTIDLGNGDNTLDARDNGDVDPDTGKFTFYNVRISAGNGNDIIDTGIGNYSIDAGSGNNWVYLTSGNSSVLAGSGNDVITTSYEDVGELFTYLFGYGVQPSYTQTIDAGNGDNQIELPVYGQTSITTGSGQDFVLVASARAQIDGTVNSDSVDIVTGSGNDTVITIDTKSLIKTGAGDDLIVSGAGDDTIYPGSGRNVINLRGLTGSIPIPSPLSNLGFLPSDYPVQGGGNDTVYLESGKDTVILGSSGTATIYGFDKNDLLDVSGLNATFTRSGNDTLISSGSTSLGVLKGYTGPVSVA